MAYFGQRYAGEIGSRVAINDKVAKVISGRLATTAIDCVMTIFYATLMFRYDVKLTLAVIAAVGLQRRRGEGGEPRPHRRQPAASSKTASCRARP